MPAPWLKDRPSWWLYLRLCCCVQGFSDVLATFKLLGLLDTTPRPFLHPQRGTKLSRRSFLRQLLGLEATCSDAEMVAAVTTRVSTALEARNRSPLSRDRTERIAASLRWLGMLSSTQLVPLKGAHFVRLCLGTWHVHELSVFCRHTIGLVLRCPDRSTGYAVLEDRTRHGHHAS